MDQWRRLFKQMRRVADGVDIAWANRVALRFKRERKDELAAKRQKALDALVPDRRCPSCKKLVLKSRGWVVRKKRALCKGCYMKYSTHEIRVSFNGRELAERRKSCGCSQKEFAELCGWSAAYQCRLETSDTASISEATMKVIEAAFSKLIK